MRNMIVALWFVCDVLAIDFISVIIRYANRKREKEKRERENARRHKNADGTVTRYCASIIPCFAYPYLISRFNEATSIFIPARNATRDATAFYRAKIDFSARSTIYFACSSLSAR